MVALVLATPGLSLIFPDLNECIGVPGIAPVDLARERLVTEGYGISSVTLGWVGVVDS
jgi:hypothetical protein